MKELFFDFLRKHNAYDKWMANFDEQVANCTFEEFFDEYDCDSFFTMAFIWEATDEEFEFWAYLANEWDAFIYDMKKDIVSMTKTQLRQLCKEACALNRPTQHDELIATSDRVFGVWFEQKLKELK